MINDTDRSIEMGHIRDLICLADKAAQIVDTDGRIKDKTVNAGLNFIGAILVDTMEQIAVLAKQLD